MTGCRSPAEADEKVAAAKKAAQLAERKQEQDRKKQEWSDKSSGRDVFDSHYKPGDSVSKSQRTDKCVVVKDEHDGFVTVFFQDCITQTVPIDYVCGYKEMLERKKAEKWKTLVQPEDATNPRLVFKAHFRQQGFLGFSKKSKLTDDCVVVGTADSDCLRVIFQDGVEQNVPKDYVLDYPPSSERCSWLPKDTPKLAASWYAAEGGADFFFYIEVSSAFYTCHSFALLF